MSSMKRNDPQAATPPSTPDRKYWRSLDELAETPEFTRFVEAEFPSLMPETIDRSSRRQFLQLMGASFAMAGLASCRWPKEKIVPYTERPDGRTPGIPVYYATAVETGGFATGLLARSYDGRPIKLEGNPEHPGSLGAAGYHAQSALLDLYDPDRLRNPRTWKDGKAHNKTWEQYETAAGNKFKTLNNLQGAGLVVLSEVSSSPSMERMRQRLLAKLPRARWVEYDPCARDSERQGLKMVFGRPQRPVLNLDRAERIVTIDEDLLLMHPDALRLARGFAASRPVDDKRMSRLTAIEAAWTLTGSVADVRHQVAARRIPGLALRLALELHKQGARIPAASGVTLTDLERGATGAPQAAWIAKLAKDLVAHRGKSVIAAGPRQPAEVHAVVAMMNEALGNVGNTVDYVADPRPERTPSTVALSNLVKSMNTGGVGMLLMLGGDPVFAAPADLDFAKALDQVETRIHVTSFENETSARCEWVLPRAHSLETWSDARAWDGTISVMQPLVQPLWQGRSPLEVLAHLLGDAPEERSAYWIVQQTMEARWTGKLPAEEPEQAEQPAAEGADAPTGDGPAEGTAPREGGAPAGQPPADVPGIALIPRRRRAFDTLWRKALHDGIVVDTAAQRSASSVARVTGAEFNRFGNLKDPDAQDWDVVLPLDLKLLDGRNANNAWLQELPDPISKLTWDNAAMINPRMARALGVEQGRHITLTAGSRSVTAPAFIMPGLPDYVAVLPLGWGRTVAGSVGQGVGVSAAPLTTAFSPHLASGVTVKKASGETKLATTQNHQAIVNEKGGKEMDRRIPELVREADLEEFKHHPNFAEHRVHTPERNNLWNLKSYETGHKWGMAIDLTRCIGCSGCVTACQAENNIPVVGKDQVLNGREMHWIRIDRYFAGEVADPRIAHQPVTCMQCEMAPCEEVCPVGATMHSEEGLNQMVYNRCVGTRYCSNNCPYKVRRFNYFHNNLDLEPVEQMKYNPDVTMRSRGVMEKCTFCIQRIEAVKIDAKNKRRPIRDGEIVPACAQSCPTQAISFGDLNDPNSRVAKDQKNQRAYALLGELGVIPRLEYLARIRNPEKSPGGGHAKPAGHDEMNQHRTHDEHGH